MRDWERYRRTNQSTAFLLCVACVGCTSAQPAQCGVASLVNVLGRAGKPIRYRSLLPRVDVVDGHTTFTDLARAARGAGVRMRGYRLSTPESLAEKDLGVLELKADHFVALVGRRGDACLVVDAPDGALHDPVAWSSARLTDEWTGNVLLVER